MATLYPAQTASTTIDRQDTTLRSMRLETSVGVIHQDGIPTKTEEAKLKIETHPKSYRPTAKTAGRMNGQLG